MTRIDSRTETVVKVASSYITSAPIEDDRWGQPPASQYVFTLVGDTLHGQLISGTEEVHVPSRSLEYLPIIDPQLDMEFQAWDMLSDEALMNFERELD